MLGWPANLEVWMLWGFFDESGDHASAHVGGSLLQLSIGGCIASFDSWNSYSTEWAKFLANHHIDCFHMVDLENYTGRFRNLDEAAHDLILREALTIMSRHIKHFFGLTVKIPANHLYNKVRRKGKRDFQSFYEHGITDMIWHAGRHAGSFQEQISLVFARHADFSLKRIEDHFGEFQSYDDRLRSVSISIPVDCAPLQAADIVAYETKQRHGDANVSKRKSRLN